MIQMMKCFLLEVGGLLELLDGREGHLLASHADHTRRVLPVDIGVHLFCFDNVCFNVRMT